MMAPRTSSQWGPPKGKVDPAQLKRTGPATRLNHNEHSDLFRPGARGLKNTGSQFRAVTPVGQPRKFTFNGDCFNCGKPGHRAADCKEPKRPRQERRTQWKKNRIPSAVSDIKVLASEAEKSGSNQQLVQYMEAFAAQMEGLVEWSNGDVGPNPDPRETREDLQNPPNPQPEETGFQTPANQVKEDWDAPQSDFSNL